MEADLAKRPVDRLIGFNKMPVWMYYAADGCFEDKAQNLRHSLYKSLAVTAILPSTSARYSPGTPRLKS